MKYSYLFVAAITLLLSLKVEAQISCGISLTQHSGCAPFAILAAANDNSPYPILERRWRLNNQYGQLVYSTLAAPGVNQNFSYIIASDTCATFYLSLWSKNTNGDTCVAYDTIFVAGNPKLQPVLAAGCNSTPKTVTLYPNATTCAGVLDTFVVDWGCGPEDILGTVPNSITHTYTCPNSCYDVSIVIKNSYGCYADTTLYNVCFNTPVTAAGYLSADSLNCPNPPQFIQYYDTSSVHTSGTWDFGDGTSSAWDTVNHYYTTTGSFIVRRIVCNGVCCDTAVIDTVVIMGPYIKSYSYSSNRLCACHDTLHLRLEIVGANSGALVAGCNTGFIGFPAFTPIGTEQNPTVVERNLHYCVTDSCQPQVILSGPGGCQTYFDLPFIYVDTPSINFGVSGSGLCGTGTVCFTDQTTYAAQHDSTALSIWNFGDGSLPDTATNPCHTFALPGIYSVTLNAFSDKGCTSSFTKQVPVGMPPVAGFIAARVDTVCNRATWMFIDTSVSAASAYISLWNFGDGQSFSSVADTLYHTYTDTGSPVVKLKVTDIAGCLDTAMISIPVSFDQLQVQANSVGTYDSCLSYTRCFSFTNTAGNATNWQWVIDGTPANGAAPCKTYYTNGQYTATIYVNNGLICADTQIINYNIQLPALPTPLFNITRQNACIDGNFCFHDESWFVTGADSIISWLWNFGDGASDTVKSPCHYYATQGTYAVTLTVVSGSGCEASFTDTVWNDYSLNPQANFTYEYWPANEVNFQDNSSGTYDFLQWHFGDGTSSQILQPPGATVTKLYNFSMVYNVMLVVWDSLGCTDSIVNQVQFIGIHETNGLVNVHVHPNPFNDFTILEIGDITESFDLTVLNLLGEKLLVKQGKPNESLRIDRDNFPAGVYVYEVRTRSGLKATGKLVVE